VLLDVWRHLEASRDRASAQAFFEKHVVHGPTLIPRIEAQRAVAAAPVEPPAPRLGEERPKTQVNLARHREILERKWLVTGYILIMRRAEATHFRRIPLNYRRIRMGTPGPRQDIVLDLPSGDTYLARLELSGGRFTVHHRYGTVNTLVNGAEVESATLSDGDTLTVGPYEMRVFKLLEPAAELQIANGANAGETFTIDISDVWIGRQGKRVNDVNLPSATVSREHARIVFQENRFWLIPQTATSPTAINGVPVEEPRALSPNDQIVMGELTLLFRLQGKNAISGSLETRVATVLFFDLRGWTTVAESTPLEDLIKQVDEYYRAMGEVIHRYGGTLMTYQGDAIMAIFGAPSAHADDPWRAVAAALRMMREMEALSQKWASEGKTALRGGIGIHTGQVIVGEIGHSSRLEYSAVGDATNLAARLEELTKEMHCAIIVSDATFREVESVVEARPLGTVTVKGRSAPTDIYEVLSLHNLELADLDASPSDEHPAVTDSGPDENATDPLPQASGAEAPQEADCPS
jgi:class 3 adenylate cyclase